MCLYAALYHLGYTKPCTLAKKLLTLFSVCTASPKIIMSEKVYKLNLSAMALHLFEHGRYWYKST